VSHPRAGGDSISLLVFLLLFSALSYAQPRLPTDQLAEKLDAAVSPLFKRDQPGGAVLLARDGKTVYRKAFGLADFENVVALTPEMPLRIGSITKQLTAAGVFLLVDEGKVALDAEVTKYLPDYPTHGKRYTDILVEPSTLTLDKSVRENIADFKDERLYFEPGEAIRYSNSNFILLGAIIEKVSGMPYGDFMAKRVFEPLGMASTAYEGHERNGRLRVEGYQRGRSKPYEKALPISMTQAYSAGGLLSTVDDMGRWGAAVDGRTLLSAESWKKMFRPFVLNDGTVTSACSGWFVERIGFGREVYGHAGGINGFASFVYWVPEDRVFVVVLLNNVGQLVNPMRVAQTMLYVALPGHD